MGESGSATQRGVMPLTVAGTARRPLRFSLDRYFTRLAILPTFVVMLGIFGIPLLYSLYLSFTGMEHAAGVVQRTVGRV